MTGFAHKAASLDDGFSATVEMRVVNGRSTDIRLRLPTGYETFESSARKALSETVKRGNATMTLSVNAPKNQSARINQSLARSLFESLDELARARGEEPPRLSDVLSVSGVVETLEEVPDEALNVARFDLVKTVFAEANGALAEARRAEGRALEKVVRGQLDAMADGLAKLETHADRTPAVVRDRLLAALNGLIGDTSSLDPQRLAQEAALLAAKADIREELDRLGAHIDAARALLDVDEPIGRRLDFLAQELNREANTICSKSASVAITAIGLDLKALVDQFKEQVQNIE